MFDPEPEEEEAASPRSPLRRKQTTQEPTTTRVVKRIRMTMKLNSALSSLLKTGKDGSKDQVGSPEGQSPSSPLKGGSKQSFLSRIRQLGKDGDFLGAVLINQTQGNPEAMSPQQKPNVTANPPLRSNDQITHSHHPNQAVRNENPSEMVAKNSKQPHLNLQTSQQIPQIQVVNPEINKLETYPMERFLQNRQAEIKAVQNRQAPIHEFEKQHASPAPKKYQGEQREVLNNSQNFRVTQQIPPQHSSIPDMSKGNTIPMKRFLVNRKVAGENMPSRQIPDKNLAHRSESPVLIIEEQQFKEKNNAIPPPQKTENKKTTFPEEYKGSSNPFPQYVQRGENHAKFEKMFMGNNPLRNAEQEENISSQRPLNYNPILLQQQDSGRPNWVKENSKGRSNQPVLGEESARIKVGLGDGDATPSKKVMINLTKDFNPLSNQSNLLKYNRDRRDNVTPPLLGRNNPSGNLSTDQTPRKVSTVNSSHSASPLIETMLKSQRNALVLNAKSKVTTANLSKLQNELSAVLNQPVHMKIDNKAAMVFAPGEEKRLISNKLLMREKFSK